MKTTILLLLLLALNWAWALTNDVAPTELKSKDEEEEEELDPVVEEMLKVDKCYDTCKQDCILEIFSPKVGLDVTNVGSCFSICGCMCNKACLDTCKQAETPFCYQNCGCPMNKTVTEDIVKQSDDFFSEPLGKETSDDLWDEFNQTLSDTLDKKFGPTKAEKKAARQEKKEKKRLNKKLEKIEQQWDDYVEQANSLGVDPAVFCNQTCSHDCFLNADTSLTPYDLLTGCLISTCKCFQADLPEPSNKISYEALMVLKHLITSADEEVNTSSSPSSATESMGVNKPVHLDDFDIDDEDTDSSKVVASPDAPQNVEAQTVEQVISPQSEPAVEAQPTVVQSSEVKASEVASSTHQETENSPADFANTVVAEQTTEQLPSNEQIDAASPTQATTVTEQAKTETVAASAETEDNYASASVENAGHFAPTSAIPIEEMTQATPVVSTESQETVQEGTVVAAPETGLDMKAETSSGITVDGGVVQESPVSTSADANTEVPTAVQSETGVATDAQPEATVTESQSEATTVTEAQPEAGSVGDASVEAVVSDEKCDLKCFGECLEMKSFVPFPVIQQCIEVRCHCKLEESAEKLEAISALFNVDSLKSAQDSGAKASSNPSTLLVSILVLMIMAILALGAYWVYRLVKGDKIKFNRFYDDGDLIYAEEPGYERII